MEDGGKSRFAAELPPIVGGITTMARGARNVLTWNELGGLDNLIKCENWAVRRNSFAGRNSLR